MKNMSNIFYYFVVMSAVSVYITYCGVLFIPERANVAYYNEKYFHNYTFAVKRYSRKGGYYINIEHTTKNVWNNNVSLSFIFNEFLHNEYRRSFVELHYKFCDLLRDEKYFAPTLMKYNMTCPLPVGTYRFINLTIPLERFPSVFPFERARLDIEYNHTITKEPMARLHVYCTMKNIRV